MCPTANSFSLKTILLLTIQLIIAGPSLLLKSTLVRHEGQFCADFSHNLRCHATEPFRYILTSVFDPYFFNSFKYSRHWIPPNTKCLHHLMRFKSIRTSFKDTRHKSKGVIDLSGVWFRAKVGGKCGGQSYFNSARNIPSPYGAQLHFVSD